MERLLVFISLFFLAMPSLAGAEATTPAGTNPSAGVRQLSPMMPILPDAPPGEMTMEPSAGATPAAGNCKPCVTFKVVCSDSLNNSGIGASADPEKCTVYIPSDSNGTTAFRCDQTYPVATGLPYPPPPPPLTTSNIVNTCNMIHEEMHLLNPLNPPCQNGINNCESEQIAYTKSIACLTSYQSAQTDGPASDNTVAGNIFAHTLALNFNQCLNSETSQQDCYEACLAALQASTLNPPVASTYCRNLYDVYPRKCIPTPTAGTPGTTTTK